MRTCENFGNIINENVIVQDSLQGVSVQDYNGRG